MQSSRVGKRRIRKAVLPLLLVFCVACTSTQPTATPEPTTTPVPSPTLTPTIIPLPTLTPVPTAVPSVLYVDVAQELGPINPLVYGANYGPWVGVLPELMPQAEASGVTFLRYPGGEWGDQNDLRDYHIDQFISFARRLYAEPFIHVRLRDGDPEKAAELVRYANVTHDYDVRYWAIGNEPSLYASIAKDETWDTERYNAEWRQFAEAMLAVDPDIVLLGPETHQYTGQPAYDPKDNKGRDWMREFLLANGDLVDMVAIHRYPFPTSRNSGSATIDDLRANSREWDTIIPNIRALIRETTGRDLPVAVTEVNSHWTHAIGGEATPDSLYSAIWWGDVLGRLIRQRVDAVAYFLLQNGDSLGGFGLLARYHLRPSYYVYQIYQRFGSELVYASSDDPDLSIYAALRDDGALTLVVVNLGPEAKTKPLVLEGSERAISEVWLFDAEHLAEQVDPASMVAGDNITLPAQSISLIVLE